MLLMGSSYSTKKFFLKFLSCETREIFLELFQLNRSIHMKTSHRVHFIWRTAILFFLEWKAKKFEFVRLTKTMERQSWLDANFVSYVIQGSRLTQQLLLLRHLPKAIGFFLYLFTSAFLGKDYFIVLRFLRKGSTKTWNPQSGNGITETETETETEYGIKYQR